MVIIAAFFQDILLAIARILGGHVADSSVGAGRAVQRGVRSIARSAATVGDRSENNLSGTNSRTGTTRLKESAPIEDTARQTTPESESSDGDSSPIDRRAVSRTLALTPTSDAEPLNTTVEPPPHPSGVVSTRNDPAAIGELSRRRQYSPSSRIHVEEQVRDFLVERGGATTVESLVRHLDREFGAGLGVGLMEASKNRGVIVTRRNPNRPTEIVVELADSENSRSADGQSSR